MEHLKTSIQGETKQCCTVHPQGFREMRWAESRSDSYGNAVEASFAGQSGLQTGSPSHTEYPTSMIERTGSAPHDIERFVAFEMMIRRITTLSNRIYKSRWIQSIANINL